MPLNILRLFLARPNYLLILFMGKPGRERRARQLATTKGQVPQTSMVAFHHALVQLLAQLAFGFHNEVEMLIQSIMPLDELCEHICDHFCPHAVRASFLVLLKETYTITQLKVAALAISPSVWQVITLLVAELRTLCECMGGYGDVEDAEQAVRQLEFSHRGPCFFEAGIDFALNFMHKHLSLSDTPRDSGGGAASASRGVHGSSASAAARSAGLRSHAISNASHTASADVSSRRRVASRVSATSRSVGASR